MPQSNQAHAPQLLKPARLEPTFCNKRSHQNEKPPHGNDEQPPLAATKESACGNEDPTQSKKKKENNLMVTKGEGMGEGYIRSLGLTDIH